MKILVDMNLSPGWCDLLAGEGWEAVHWSTVGAPTAPDVEVMAYAKAQGFVILTHDLDFGTLLALTAADGPSVIQVRSQDLLSDAFREILVAALGQFEADLQVGAIVVIDGSRARARVLPLSRGA